MRRAVRAIVFKDNDLLVMKRNKFGKQYCTLPGGGVSMAETVEQALAREMSEETGLQLGTARLVFTEDAGEPYGVQYIFLVNYISGEPRLSPASDEAAISAMGKNTYEPMWLPMGELADTNFVSVRLRDAIIKAAKSSFPQEPVHIV